jgi:DNA-binding NtrC family response regulator
MKSSMGLAMLLKSFLKYRKPINKKVLLIDDDKICLKYSSLVINQLYFYLDIVTARTGKNALYLIKNNHFDFIFLDLGLPDISGIDVLKIMNIKEDDMRKVIVLTSYHEEYMKVACFKFRAYSFIEKPLDLNKLLNAIS